MSALKTTSLKVRNEIIEIENPAIFKWSDVFLVIQSKIQDGKSKYIIKLNLVKTKKDKLYFNVVSIEGLKGFVSGPFNSCQKLKTKSQELGISCLIIPTGIGAAFGGYAGDANPIAKLLASQCDYLLTHPNVVNGAVLSDPPSNLIYIEGFLLDQFLLGNIGINSIKQNKIGVIFDKAISEERLEYEVNVLNALRAFYGSEIISWTITEKSLNINPSINLYGFSEGKIENLDSLLESANKLKEKGVTAIAICCAIPDLELNSGYALGSGIDPIGGIESIISRSVSAYTGLVSAHAPVLIGSEKTNYKKISPLSAAEYIAPTFLPSVISGLRFAPEITSNQQSKISNRLTSAFVPYNAFGSPGVFSMNEVFKNVILIEENKTCLDINPKHLNIDFKTVKKYIDLVDLKKIEKAGIDPGVLKRPLSKIDKV